MIYKRSPNNFWTAYVGLPGPRRASYPGLSAFQTVDGGPLSMRENSTQGPSSAGPKRWPIE